MCLPTRKNGTATAAPEETAQLALVRELTLVGWDNENPAAERLDLLPRNQRGVVVNKEVKLNTGAVDVAVVIHDDMLDAAAIHLAHDLGHPNHRPVFLLPNITPKVRRNTSASMPNPAFLT